MKTSIIVNISNVFCNDFDTDLTNINNTFKSNIHVGFGFVNVTKYDSSNISINFDRHIGIAPDDDTVNQILQQQVDELVQSYATTSLETLKNTHIDIIDQQTRALIANGAIYDGHYFSLSDNAQRNWIAIRAAVDTYVALNAFPVPLTTYDDSIYLLNNAQHLIEFTTAMLMAVAKHYNSGRDLKLLVKAATTKQEVLAVVDKRK